MRTEEAMNEPTVDILTQRLDRLWAWVQGVLLSWTWF